MKFRMKFRTQTYSMTIDDSQASQTIGEFKAHLQTYFSSLKHVHFHLSLNGKHSLHDKQTIAQSGLVNGDTIYVLNEYHYPHSCLLSVEQPLTLDEVRDGDMYPQVIHRLLESTRIENDFEYIVIILHGLMLENGFQMVNIVDHARTIVHDKFRCYHVFSS
jgi:hypothetical protein